VQFLGIHQAGVRNDAADGLSREAVDRVLQEVSNAGFRVERLPIPDGFWELCHSLLELPPAVCDSL
jgi:hypothetical protein